MSCSTYRVIVYDTSIANNKRTTEGSGAITLAPSTNRHIPVLVSAERFCNTRECTRALLNRFKLDYYAGHLNCARVKGRRPKAHQHYRVSTPGGFRLGTNFHRRDLGTRRFRWKGRRKTSCFGQTTRKTSQCRHSECYVFRLSCSF